MWITSDMHHRRAINMLNSVKLTTILTGLGDTSDGISDLAERFQRAIPYTKFIVPTAPVIPVTLSGGMPMSAW